MAAGTTIDAVWDDAVRVLRHRRARIAAVAAVAFALPAVAQAALRAFPVLGPARGAVLALLVSVAGLLLSLWGGLAVIALASDPAPAPGEARGRAWRRLPPSLGVAALLALALVALSLPLGLVAAFAGADMTALASGGVPPLPAGAARGLALATLVFAAVGLWAGARLLPVQAVVLHERRGTGAIAAAFRSTRGLALRLIGAELVFLVVAGVVTTAVQGALGTMLALLLGPARLGAALFVAGAAAALVSAALTAIAWVFVARLYAALAPVRQGGPLSVPASAPA